MESLTSIKLEKLGVKIDVLIANTYYDTYCLNMTYTYYNTYR